MTERETAFENRIKDLLWRGKMITEEEKKAIAEMYAAEEMKQPKEVIDPDDAYLNGESPSYWRRKFEEEI